MGMSIIDSANGERAYASAMEASLATNDAASTKFAQGWYLVSWSADLEPGGVKPLRYFGQDYVLFRGEDGNPTLLDAHCPHLGAHFGYGGRVEGNDIICPFHGWRFGSSGRCTEVPYASRIPPRAAVHAYRVQEHSGMILAYFGAEGSEPDYEVPVLEEIGDPAWTPLQHAHMEIATHPREVIENIADFAHFGPVHQTYIQDFKVIIDGPRATQRSIGYGHGLKGERIDMAIEGIRDGRFWILSKLGKSDERLQTRTRSILQRKNPEPTQ
jgi:phenylpropionate dioxygenase-like ring-hydroxylating dioxygenase large terminal subunit